MPASMCANGRDVRRVVGVDEHPRVVGGERVAAVRRGGRRVLDLDQAGHSLLLEPLARVSRRDAGRLGELVADERPVLLERTVEAELRPQIHGVELEGAERGAEEALCEGVGAVEDGGHCRASPCS